MPVLFIRDLNELSTVKELKLNTWLHMVAVLTAQLVQMICLIK